MKSNNIADLTDKQLKLTEYPPKHCELCEDECSCLAGCCMCGRLMCPDCESADENNKVPICEECCI